MSKIKFITISDSNEAANFLAEKLLPQLKQQTALLTLSGGSAIEVEIDLLKKLEPVWHNLTICLIDERFGAAGHADSNWTQLRASGLPEQIQKYEILKNDDFEKTVTGFNNFLSESVSKYDLLIGILGIGTDGHTAGLLPGSPPLKSSVWAAGFQGPDYVRITATPLFLSQLDLTYVYALGEAKWSQLKAFEQDLPAETQPAQVLKRSKQLTILTDLK